MDVSAACGHARTAGVLIMCSQRMCGAGLDGWMLSAVCVQLNSGNGLCGGCERLF